MSSHEHMVSVINAYIDGFANCDVEAIAQLFASQATVEDPIGAAIQRGCEAIRLFYAAAVATGARLTLQGEVRTAGRIAAFAFSVSLPEGAIPRRIEIIDVSTFDESGKILEMRAFWGPSNVHAV